MKVTEKVGGFKKAERLVKKLSIKLKAINEHKQKISFRSPYC